MYLLWWVCMWSHFSHVQLYATLWTIAHQDPLSMGVSREDYWSGLPCPPPGDLPEPGIEPMSLISCFGRQVLHHSATWEAHLCGSSKNYSFIYFMFIPIWILYIFIRTMDIWYPHTYNFYSFFDNWIFLSLSSGWLYCQLGFYTIMSDNNRAVSTHACNRDAPVTFG